MRLRGDENFIMKKKDLIQELNKDTIIKFLRENKDYLEREFGVNQIALFVSYARGDATRKSDIDILVDLEVVYFFKRFYLQEFLEKKFKRKVDVGYFDSVRKFIKDRIEEILIYI